MIRMSENVMTLPVQPRVPSWGWGDRVRKVRREMRLSQAAFADLLGKGVSDKAVGAWESGANAGPDDRDVMAVRLEAATGVDRAWWLGWRDYSPVPTPGASTNSGCSRRGGTVVPFPGASEHATALLPAAA